MALADAPGQVEKISVPDELSAEPQREEARPAAPVARRAIVLPEGNMMMVAQPTLLYGVQRYRGEVLSVDGTFKQRTLASVGKLVVLPYGAVLTTCGCGRQWTSDEAQAQHECPSLVSESEAGKAPARQRR